MNNHLTEPPRAPGRWSDRALWLTPLFGVLAGALLLSEKVSSALAAALLLVALGIWLVNRPTKRL